MSGKLRLFIAVVFRYFGVLFYYVWVLFCVCIFCRVNTRLGHFQIVIAFPSLLLCIYSAQERVKITCFIVITVLYIQNKSGSALGGSAICVRCFVYSEQEWVSIRWQCYLCLLFCIFRTRVCQCQMCYKSGSASVVLLLLCIFRTRIGQFRMFHCYCCFLYSGQEQISLGCFIVTVALYIQDKSGSV